MKKVSFILGLAICLCALPLSMHARCNVSFSFLFDAASMFMGPRCCPPPPPVYVLPPPPQPMPCYPGVTTVTREYWTPHGVYQRQVVVPHQPPCYYPYYR
jgi:hypothetical protein